MIKNVSVKTLETVLMEKKKKTIYKKKKATKWMYVASEQSLIFTTNQWKYKQKNIIIN